MNGKWLIIWGVLFFILASCDNFDLNNPIAGVMTHSPTPSPFGQTPTNTPAPTSTWTPTTTQTSTPSDTQTPTPTNTQTPTATNTQIPTPTDTMTSTNSPTPTPIPTPNVPSTPDLDSASDSGINNVDDLTNAVFLTFNGTSDPDVSIELFQDGLPCGLTAADAGGNWSIMVDATALPDGVYAFSARAQNVGGYSLYSPSIFVTLDTTQPTVTIDLYPGQTNPSNAATLNFAVDFDEPVWDFTNSSAFVSGSAGGGLVVNVSGGSTAYCVSVTGMVTNGTVILSVPVSMAHDYAGNSNSPSFVIQDTIDWDGTSPGVMSITSLTQLNTGANPIPVTIIFNEPVDPATFTAADLSVTSGTAGIPSTSDNMTWDVDIVPTGTHMSSIMVSVNPGSVADFAGNLNGSGPSLNRTYINMIGYDNGFMDAVIGGGTTVSTVSSVTVNPYDNRMVLAFLHFTKASALTITSVNYGATAMMLVPGATLTYSGGVSELTAIYYINNPPTGPSEQVQVMFGSGGSHDGAIGVAFLYDTRNHSGTAIGNISTATMTTPTVLNNITGSLMTSSADSNIVEITGGDTVSTMLPNSGQMVIQNLSGPVGIGFSYMNIPLSGTNQSIGWNFATDQTERIQQILAEILIAQ